jgi:hypothetical protein
MTRSIYLANRVREVLLNGRWIANTNYKDQLEELSLAQAVQKHGSLNTIAALTFHVNYYLAGVVQVLEGGALDIRDKYSFDLPPLTSETAWKDLRGDLLVNAEKFATLVEKLPDHKLDTEFVDVKYGSYLRNIEGVIEHCYYHLGQISLIKKLMDTDR